MAINFNSITSINNIGVNTYTLERLSNISSISSSINTIAEGNNIISDLFGFLKTNKAVAMFDANDNEILTSCLIQGVEINDDSRLAEQPLEDGTNISDHKVFLQKEISLVIYMPEDDYSSSVEQLYNLYTTNQFIKIQTKGRVYDNLQIVSLPHSETNQNVNRLIYKIQLREAMTVSYSIRGYNASGSGNASSKFTNPSLEETDSLQKKVFDAASKGYNKISGYISNLFGE